ncbi:MAG: hypothetical protein ACK5MU_00265 [Candidatus Saccharimonadales bacterium]
MEKKLKAYTDFLKTVSNRPTPELAKYHALMLKNFQHERLVHLIVTMFFALFLIIFFIFTVILFLVIPQNSIWSAIITYGSAFITLIFFVTTLFYVHHYYKLENGVQKLENLTPKLHKIV